MKYRFSLGQSGTVQGSWGRNQWFEEEQFDLL
jgi:hypothetical protein